MVYAQLRQYGVCALSRRSFYLFCCETKQRPEPEISDETGSGGEKAGPREARGAVGQGTQRGSVGEGRLREAVDNGGERRTVGFEWTAQRMSESIEVRKATFKIWWATQRQG